MMHDNDVPLTTVIKQFALLSEYLEGERELGTLERSTALYIAGFIDGATGAVVRMFDKSESGAPVLLSDPITTHTFLVHFGKDAKGITLDAREMWREFFDDICHRMGDLRIIASGLTLCDERHESSRRFFQELVFWAQIQP